MRYANNINLCTKNKSNIIGSVPIILSANEMNGAYHDNENDGEGTIRTSVGPRIVNFNYGSYGVYSTPVKQHGLWIDVSVAAADNPAELGNWGQALNNLGTTGTPLGSPETGGRIIIRATNITNALGPVTGSEFSYDASSRLDEFIKDIIAHEGSHRLSVEHHTSLAQIAVTNYPGDIFDWLNCDIKNSYDHYRTNADGDPCVLRYLFFDISAAVAGDLDKDGIPEKPTDTDWTTVIPAISGFCDDCKDKIDINDN